MEILNSQLKELAILANNFEFNLIEKIIDILQNALLAGKTLFFCGNGGSASTAQHISQDFYSHLKNVLPSIKIFDLVGSTTVLSAIANDRGFAHVFSERLSTFASTDDILIAYSVSGSSENVIAALQEINLRGGKGIFFRGMKSTIGDQFSTITISIPSNNIQSVENMHLAISHAIILELSQRLENIE